MGTRRPRIGGHGRPNRLVQELLVERAMREIADGDKRTRQAPRPGGGMGNQRRLDLYAVRTGRATPTPAQRRRVAKKSWRVSNDPQELLFGIVDEVAA